MSLLTAFIVRKYRISAGIYFMLLRNVLDLTLNSLILSLDLSKKIRKVAIN